MQRYNQGITDYRQIILSFALHCRVLHNGSVRHGVTNWLRALSSVWCYQARGQYSLQQLLMLSFLETKSPVCLSTSCSLILIWQLVCRGSRVPVAAIKPLNLNQRSKHILIWINPTQSFALNESNQDADTHVMFNADVTERVKVFVLWTCFCSF